MYCTQSHKDIIIRYVKRMPFKTPPFFSGFRCNHFAVVRRFSNLICTVFSCFVSFYVTFINTDARLGIEDTTVPPDFMRFGC